MSCLGNNEPKAIFPGDSRLNAHFGFAKPIGRARNIALVLLAQKVEFDELNLPRHENLFWQ